MHGYGGLGMRGVQNAGNFWHAAGYAAPLMVGIMIFKIVIFIVLVVLAIKYVKKYRLNNSVAMNILNEKYANGEIDEEDYMRKKTNLTRKVTLPKKLK